MRAILSALALALALAGFAGSATAHCYDGHAAKNDFETPPPAPSVRKPVGDG